MTRVCSGAAPLIFLVVWSMGCATRSTHNGTELPATFEADRIFVDVALRGGETLRFYTDTGGGLFLFGQAADRIGLEDEEGLLLSEAARDVSFPQPLGAEKGKIPIYRPEEPDVSGYDGLLGQAWFADRVWTFDYAARRLLLHEKTPALPLTVKTAPLGFLADEEGERQLSFPRIGTLVDGEALDMLLDTGAMVSLTPEARREIGDSAPATRATSFITSEVLSRWRQQNPDWRVVPAADERTGTAMIEVPAVTIAGMTVGPVWFTERPDANFHEFMAQWLDRRVDGALGGNALRFFRVTVDYPAAEAHFVRTDVVR